MSRAHSGGNRQNNSYKERRQGYLQGIRIAPGNQLRHALVIAERGAEIAVQHAFPIVDILFPQRRIETIGVARGSDICRWRTLAEHLLNRISGNQVNQKKDQRHYQPDYGQGVEDALEKRSKHALASRPTLCLDYLWIFNLRLAARSPACSPHPLLFLF